MYIVNYLIWPGLLVGERTQKRRLPAHRSGAGSLLPQGLAAVADGIGRPEEWYNQYIRDEPPGQASTMSAALPTAAPAVSYQALFRSLSRERMQAYSLESDRDSVDAAARYLWNMALGAAITPVLHLVEVALRNAIYEVGCETTSHRRLTTGTVRCWLDAVPTLLEPREAAEVVTAIQRLGTNPRRHTPGHLVGQLGFGFWIGLCERPYEHGRSSGPQLWPRAVKRFQNAPRTDRHRAAIRSALIDLRDYRNMVAHYHPIWDRNPVRWHSRAIEVLGWMNPGLAAVARNLSSLEAVFHAGPAAFRSDAAKSLYI